MVIIIVAFLLPKNFKRIKNIYSIFKSLKMLKTYASKNYIVSCETGKGMNQIVKANNCVLFPRKYCQTRK